MLLDQRVGRMGHENVQDTGQQSMTAVKQNRNKDFSRRIMS